MDDPLADKSKLDCVVRLNAYEESGLYEVLWDLWTRFPELHQRELEARAAIRSSILRLAESDVAVAWRQWSSSEDDEPVPVADLPDVLDWVEVWRPGHRLLYLWLLSERTNGFADCLAWRNPDPSIRASDVQVDSRLWLLATPHDLVGTAYVELFPGSYAGKHWQPGSLFLTEERWGHIEPVIERHVREYDPHGVTEVSAVRWSPILTELGELGSFLRDGFPHAKLSSRIGFLSPESEIKFLAVEEESRAQLAGMTDELAGWVRRRLAEQPVITILGL